MSEIKLNDTQEMRSSLDGYKQIKPYSSEKIDDVRKSITDALQNKEIKPDVDDNGKPYKIADELIKNNKYELNGFKYETDDYGRIKSAEGIIETTHADPQRNMPSMEKVGKGDQQEADHRGHIAAHMFGGKDDIGNLVAMDGKLNETDYKAWENKLAVAHDSGDEVSLKVDVVYKTDSNRPSEFRCTSIINGEKEVTVFKNGEK